MDFAYPQAVLFSHQSSSALIVACKDVIFIYDVSKQSTQAFSGAFEDSFYERHALALSNDGAMLVVGSSFSPYRVCAFSTVFLTRLWTCNMLNRVDAVCVLGSRVLVTVFESPTLVLDLNTGTQVAALKKPQGFTFGLGVIEGLCFILDWLHIPSDLHTSVYLAMLQHLLYKQAHPLHLPLEMWDWIAKYRV